MYNSKILKYKKKIKNFLQTGGASPILKNKINSFLNQFKNINFANLETFNDVDGQLSVSFSFNGECREYVVQVNKICQTESMRKTLLVDNMINRFNSDPYNFDIVDDELEIIGDMVMVIYLIVNKLPQININDYIKGRSLMSIVKNIITMPNA